MSLNYIKNFYEGCVSKTMCVHFMFIFFFLMFHYFCGKIQKSHDYTVKSDADLTLKKLGNPLALKSLSK